MFRVASLSRFMRCGDAADGKILDVRVLSGNNTQSLSCLALVVERFQVMGNGHQVRLGRQLHGRVAPVGVGERAELAAVDQGLDLGLDRCEALGTVARPVGQGLGQLLGSHRIGIERGDDIDPVKGGECIEMDYVVMQAVDALNQVPDQLGIQWNLKLQCVFNGTNGCQGMDGGADAADTLDEMPGVARVSALENDFKSPEHLAG